MSIVVMKFGGTSVANAELIRAAARRAVRARKRGHQVVVVVSAMGKTTDHLEDLAAQLHPNPPRREYDQLVTTGEQVTISLMAMALDAMGVPAISFTAGQIGMVTDDAHTKAKIKRIDVQRIHRELDAGKIAIIAGFQGVTEDGAYTTLGRGGSNVTLVAIAAALGADQCDNLTDVDGVFTADPNIVPNARKIDRISYDEMLELSSLGASVLHNRAVEFAKKYNVPIHVRSSQHYRKGTMIVAETQDMERIAVRGAALTKQLARITLRDTPDRPGVLARIFHAIAKVGIVVDDIIQTETSPKLATVSFTVEMKDIREARQVCSALAKKTRGMKVDCLDDLAKVSVVGVGMRTHTGVAERMFKALADGGVNIRNVTTSEIKLSCIIDRAEGPKALRLVHDAFELGSKPKKKAKKKATRKKTTKKKAAKKKTKKK